MPTLPAGWPFTVRPAPSFLISTFDASLPLSVTSPGLSALRVTSALVSLHAATTTGPSPLPAMPWQTEQRCVKICSASALGSPGAAVVEVPVAVDGAAPVGVATVPFGGAPGTVPPGVTVLDAVGFSVGVGIAG